jgi:hypothetical protein
MPEATDPAHDFDAAEALQLIAQGNQVEDEHQADMDHISVEEEQMLDAASTMLNLTAGVDGTGTSNGQARFGGRSFKYHLYDSSSGKW